MRKIPFRFPTLYRMVRAHRVEDKGVGMGCRKAEGRSDGRHTSAVHRPAAVCPSAMLGQLDGAAAVNGQGDAGHELGLVGDEVDRCPGDVFWFDKTPEWNGGDELGAVLRRVGH